MRIIERVFEETGFLTSLMKSEEQQEALKQKYRWAEIQSDPLFLAEGPYAFLSKRSYFVAMKQLSFIEAEALLHNKTVQNHTPKQLQSPFEYFWFGTQHENMLDYLTPKELCRLAAVSRAFNQVFSARSVWQPYITNYTNLQGNIVPIPKESRLSGRQIYCLLSRNNTIIFVYEEIRKEALPPKHDFEDISEIMKRYPDIVKIQNFREKTFCIFDNVICFHIKGKYKLKLKWQSFFSEFKKSSRRLSLFDDEMLKWLNFFSNLEESKRYNLFFDFEKVINDKNSRTDWQCFFFEVEKMINNKSSPIPRDYEIPKLGLFEIKE